MFERNARIAGQAYQLVKQRKHGLPDLAVLIGAHVEARLQQAFFLLSERFIGVYIHQ